MKFSGISLLARRRKWVKKQQNMPPPPGAAPAAPTQGGMAGGRGKKWKYVTPLGRGSQPAHPPLPETRLWNVCWTLGIRIPVCPWI